MRFLAQIELAGVKRGDPCMIIDKDVVLAFGVVRWLVWA